MPRIDRARFKAEQRTQPLFKNVASVVHPSSILEIGSWMGSSAVAWIEASSEYNPSSVVYCVDTWLGSVEHYLNQSGSSWGRDKLSIDDYGPNYFDDFLEIFGMLVCKIG